MNIYDFAVIGGGPAGMFALLEYKRKKPHGNAVLIEKNGTLGRKLLATGGGRCNLTNKIVSDANYHGSNPKFVRNLFSRFSSEDLQSFFTERGVSLQNEKGRIFTKSGKASDILNVLERELRTVSAEIILGKRVDIVAKEKNGFRIDLENGESVFSKNLLIASGGASYPQLGSTEDSVKFAEIMKVKCSVMKPALTGINSDDRRLKGMRGVSFRAVFILLKNGKKVCRIEGDAITTDYGLSGPAVMDITNFIEDTHKDKYIIKVNFQHGTTCEDEYEKLTRFCENNKKLSVKRYFEKSVPSRISTAIISGELKGKNEKCGMISREDRKRLSMFFTGYEAAVTSLRGMEEAQAVKGGVDLAEVDPKTMQSVKVKGLYFAGDALDIWGDCGGYNLQFAFSSGMIVGSSVAVE